MSGVYGLILVALGAVELGLELQNLTTNSENVWQTLSANQKLYFSNDVSNLQSERQKNVATLGAFAIVVGVMFVVQAVTLHLLYQQSAVKWVPPSVSRMPQIESHEQMDFVYLHFRDEEEAQHSSMPQPDEGPEEDEVNQREDTELVQKERQEMAANALMLQYGTRPGEASYDQYANYQAHSNPLNIPDGFVSNLGGMG